MDIIVRTAPQLGAAVRRYRRQRKLTQEALGRKVRTRQATISKLEAGEPGTQLRTVLDALAALDLELVVKPRSKASVTEIEDAF
jgi:HTH-type transcriptional regulator/antitoxin HipB